MWTRAELKKRAKANLKNYYWWAVLVCFLFSLLGGSGGGNLSAFSLKFGNGSGESTSGFEGAIGGTGGFTRPGVMNKTASFEESLVWLGIFLVIFFVILIAGVILSVFVRGPVAVGVQRFFMESRLLHRSAGVDKMLAGFKKRYLNVVWTVFKKNFIIGLAGLAASIPMLVMIFNITISVMSGEWISGGLVGSIFLLAIPPLAVELYLEYKYYFVEYILSENPEMPASEVLRLSGEMVRGHKFRIFILELSFFGWAFLGAIACCGVGMFLVLPYIMATNAELYAVLRVPFKDRLNGFGILEQEPYDGAGDYWQNTGYPGNQWNAQNQNYSNNQWNAQNQNYPNSRQNAQNQNYPNSQWNTQNQGYPPQDTNSKEQ